MKLNIKKLQEGGNIPTFKLPQVEVYPQNKFGNIARKQGLKTARNWRKVKWGTTAGINNFGNKIWEGLQTVSEFTPVVGDIIDAGDLYNSFKNKNYYGATLASLGFIPFLGDVSKLFVKTSKKLQKIDDIKDLSKLSDVEWDTLYNKAVKENNLEEIRKIRDLHFKTKAPNTKIIDNDGNLVHMYHGTPNKWNIYDRKYFGTSTDNGMYGEGLYTTSKKNYANTYATIYGSSPTKGEVKDLYLNIENPFYVETSKNMDAKDLVNREEAAFLFNRPKQFQIKGNIPEDIFNEVINADGVIERKGTLRPSFSEVVVPKSNQVKLSNPITYDDTGKIIPISKRDNFLNPDIRYSIIPLSLLGLWNTQNNDN